MLRQQISVLAQAIRRALDVHDDRVMQQTIKQRRCHHTVAEHFAPFTEASI
jgi:hypothetical protein